MQDLDCYIFSRRLDAALPERLTTPSATNRRGHAGKHNRHSMSHLRDCRQRISRQRVVEVCSEQPSVSWAKASLADSGFSVTIGLQNQLWLTANCRDQTG